ncbi:Annexin A11 [Portunus trituberculatus]|uniref:Annexin A11 n=1 Tax=Portunus trituberculatus TaxID=210409 RepID=A0A5B7K154_PORTR|nr:Annexin A11 [Portunus trituberculatus]
MVEVGVAMLHILMTAAFLRFSEHGVNKDEVVKAFSSLSFKQLKGIFVEYYKLAERTLGEAFDLVYKGEEKTNMHALFQCLNNRHAYLASALHKAMAGPGTKDRDLIRLIVSRAEVDLLNIKEEYFKMYNKTLESDVKGDTSGDYKKVLLTLLKPNY